MRGVVPALEKHHNVRILDDGLDAAVRLSHRYLADRQLPDKAVSVLDTACARLALGQSCHAAGRRGRKAHARRSRGAGARARARSRRRGGSRRAARGDRGRSGLRSRRGSPRSRRAGRQERDARVARYASCATTLGGRTPGRRRRGGHARRASRAELTSSTTSSTRCRARRRSMRVCVDASLVGEVISGWTGIPVGKMLRDEIGDGARAREALSARA